MKSVSRHTRRCFLAQSAGWMGAAVAAPTVITASAIGRDGRPAPSGRVVMGCIGSGRRGQVNIGLLIQAEQVQFVAVCDVDRKMQQEAKTLIDKRYGNSDCAVYTDFRELLDRGDIQAVDVSTPEHWHAIPTIEACKRGIDVHVEKPLSLTLEEGRAMVSVARRYDRIVQTGSEFRSNQRTRFVCELVRNGRIGQVKEVYVDLRGPSHMRKLRAQPVPPELDWELWLGPAPWRPYNSGYHPRGWRGFYDFSGGHLADWGAHRFDLVQWALGMDDSGPVEIHPPDGTEHQYLTYVYANGTRMYQVPAGYSAPIEGGPEMLNPITMIGTEGKLDFNIGGRAQADPPSVLESSIGPDEIHLHRCPPGGHECGDFLTSIRTRQKPGADVEIGHRTASIAHLGSIAYRLRRSLKWDPVKEKFTDDREANAMRSRAQREPWSLT